MNIQPITFKRGNYNYNLYLGVDTITGNAVDYIDRVEVDEKTGYPVRYFPDSTFIKRDRIQGEGAVEYIESIYIKTLLDSFNKPMSKENEFLTFRTNNQDVIYFVAGFGIPIMKSGNNGFFRAKLGFNDTRLFDLNGNLITYTEEELSAEPTFTYYDSSTINP